MYANGRKPRVRKTTPTKSAASSSSLPKAQAKSGSTNKSCVSYHAVVGEELITKQLDRWQVTHLQVVQVETVPPLG